MSDILSQHFCCSEKKIEISSFPFYNSEDFARCIHAKCETCGMTWIPKIDFSLNDYYKKSYATDVQPFRTHKGNFYSNQNDFIGSVTYIKMESRANKHLELAGDSESKSILDIGPGIGLTLKISRAKEKYAIELDPFSRRVLTDELNVKLISSLPYKKKFDIIIASHVVEHMPLDEAFSTLRSCRNALKKGGVLIIEVPRGADQVNRSANGDRSGVRFEPHTLSFSSYGLYRMLLSTGFTVQKITRDKSSGFLLPRELPEFADQSIVSVASVID